MGWGPWQVWGNIPWRGRQSYLHGEDRKNFKNEDGALYSHVLPGETVCKSDAKHSLPTRAMDVCRGLHLP